MNFNLVQNFQKGLILNSLLKLLLGNFTGKSIIQAGTFLAVHDIPHLRLAILTFILHGILIIRMYLDRQIILRINKFDQQRKLAVMAAVSTGNLLSLHEDILAECFSGIFSVCHIAGSVRVAAKLPGLCKLVAVIFFSKFCHQSCAAPQIILAAGF